MDVQTSNCFIWLQRHSVRVLVPRWFRRASSRTSHEELVRHLFYKVHSHLVRMRMFSAKIKEILRSLIDIHLKENASFKKD
jgi:hypothetical protein